MTLPSKGVPERQRGRGMLVRLLGKLLLNPINISLRRGTFRCRRIIGRSARKSPLKGVPERQRGRGMLVRRLGKLWVNPINIPLRRFAFATRCGPPSKGEFSM